MKTLLTLALVLLFAPAFGQTPNAHYNKADAFLAKKQYGKALDEIELGLKSDTSRQLRHKYSLLKGEAMIQLEQYQAAYDFYSGMLTRWPDDAYVLNDRALLLSGLKQFRESIEDYDHALRFEVDDSMHVSLLLNRSSSKIAIRDFNGAYEDLIDAYGIDSVNIGVLNNLAMVCDEIGKGDQTLKYLHKVLAIDSGFFGGWLNIGFKYQEMGEHRTAIRYFDKAISIDPKHGLGYSNRAFNKYKIGELSSAMDDINKSIKLYPGNSYAYKVRALIFVAQKNKAKACEDLHEAIRLGYTEMYGEEVKELLVKYCGKGAE